MLPTLNGPPASDSECNVDPTPDPTNCVLRSCIMPAVRPELVARAGPLGAAFCFGCAPSHAAAELRFFAASLNFSYSAFGAEGI